LLWTSGFSASSRGSFSFIKRGITNVLEARKSSDLVCDREKVLIMSAPPLIYAQALGKKKKALILMQGGEKANPYQRIRSQKRSAEEGRISIEVE